jgi:hypothetical protein
MSYAVQPGAKAPVPVPDTRRAASPDGAAWCRAPVEDRGLGTPHLPATPTPSPRLLPCLLSPSLPAAGRPGRAAPGARFGASPLSLVGEGPGVRGHAGSALNASAPPLCHPRLDPGIQPDGPAWMAGSSPAMTSGEVRANLATPISSPSPPRETSPVNEKPRGSRPGVHSVQPCGRDQAPSTLDGSTFTPGPIVEVTAMRWM